MRRVGNEKMEKVSALQWWLLCRTAMQSWSCDVSLLLHAPTKTARQGGGGMACDVRCSIQILRYTTAPHCWPPLFVLGSRHIPYRTQDIAMADANTSSCWPVALTCQPSYPHRAWYSDGLHVALTQTVGSKLGPSEA